MKIYYFSRTGRSKEIAEQIASRYHTTARLIDDHRNWKRDGFKKIIDLVGKDIAVPDIVE